jgi:biotin operon repressor
MTTLTRTGKEFSTPTVSDYLKDSILLMLKDGKENAVTGKELAKRLGERGDRRIRLAIRELIHDGVPIASTVTGEPKGYFVAVNDSEAREYVGSLTSRLREDHERISDFERASKLKGARPGQLALV